MNLVWKYRVVIGYTMIIIAFVFFIFSLLSAHTDLMGYGDGSQTMSINYAIFGAALLISSIYLLSNDSQTSPTS